MTTSPSDLRGALEAMYAEFARYRPKGPIDHSPIKPHSVVEPLETKPLHELNAKDFAGYAGAAVWTIGSESDFKYFFPRLAEIALHEVVGAGSWDSWAARLGPCLTTTSERLVAQGFFRNLWKSLEYSYWETVKVYSVAVLYALPAIFDDTRPLLSEFDPCRSREAALHLKDICESGPSHAGPSDIRPEPIVEWLRDRAPSLLTEAFKRYPDIVD